MIRSFVTRWRVHLAVLLGCCATFVAAEAHDPAVAATSSNHTWMLANVRKDLGQPWLCIDSRLYLGKQFRVSRLPVDGGGPIRLVVSDFEGRSGNTIWIDLWKFEDHPGKPWVDAKIVWRQDTQPFEIRWDDVFGEVWISSIDWEGDAPVLVHFDLHGTRDGKPHSASGEVTLPR